MKVDRKRAVVTVSRDGMWPFQWRWSITVAIIDQGEDYGSTNSHRMSGEALTKKRAAVKAYDALATMEAFKG